MGLECKFSHEKTQAVCVALVSRESISPSKIDIGVGRTFFSRRGAFRRLTGAADAKLASGEVYKKALLVAGTNRSFQSYLGALIEVPWLPYAGQRFTQDDADMEGWMRKTLERIEQEAGQAKLPPEEVFARVFEELKRPQSEGGMGLVFDPTPKSVPRTMGEIFRDHKATCLDFTLLMMRFAAMSGRSSYVVPLEVYRTPAGRFEEHLRIGIVNGTGKILRIFDVQKDREVSVRGRGREREVWLPISDAELLSYYYNAKAVSSSDPVVAEEFLDQALAMNSDNFLLLFNKAYYRSLQKDYKGARRYLLRSIRANPYYPEVYHNLSIVETRLRHPAEAADAQRKYRSFPVEQL